MRHLAARMAILAMAPLLGAATQAETVFERGAYLMGSIVACGNCHTEQGPVAPAPGRELAGGTKFDEPPFTAYASNITPDPETGIGTWTDAQIITAIREGRRPDGSIIGPPMPIEVYRGMSDSDVKAIVAYLRKVKPLKNAVPKSVYRITLPTSYGPPVGVVPDVPRSNKIAYGAYLAGPLGHCIVCHSPMTAGKRDFSHVGAGGPPLHGPWGEAVPPNITPDPKHGIGTWTDGQIKEAITKGMDPHGRELSPPMAYRYYQRIHVRDLDALVAYLRSLQPIATP
ncbi:MAG TPA: c-type cytochrome [Candidatus Sulfotelmatobacter sp.]|nr:c-type cytochrome [Candidatus Sulfotelmatobacter sp.]